MKKEGLAFFTDVHWTLVGLVIFFALFVLLIVLQQIQYKKDDVRRIEKLPFEGETP